MSRFKSSDLIVYSEMFIPVLDSKVVKQIILLCHILPPKRRLIVKKKHWKFSIQECIESIIIHATVSIVRN